MKGEKKQMKIYGIYDLQDKEQCLRVGDIREIAEFLSITPRRLNSAIRKRVYENRYEILYMFEEG